MTQNIKRVLYALAIIAIVLGVFGFASRLLFGERDGRIATLPRLLRVLKPGGILGAIDAHTSKADERDESVHRMNEDMARQEIESGGFEFVGKSEALYNAEDTFVFDGRRAGDPIHRYYIQRWVLKFRKPLS